MNSGGIHCIGANPHGYAKSHASGVPSLKYFEFDWIARKNRNNYSFSSPIT
jgi:hypothetical protein